MTSMYGPYGSSLRDLPRLRSGFRGRASSWDRTGGNDDRVTLPPGERAVLCELDGAGCITHIWVTVANAAGEGPAARERDYLRRLALRMYWDGQEDPSVAVPLGDFFGAGHGRTVNFVSAPLQMSPQDGRGFNSFFPMPFARGARIEVESEMSEEDVLLYYYVDYERYDDLGEDLGRFHAQWRRENPCDGVAEGTQTNAELLFGGSNLDGDGNYVILDARGRGHYVGCVLNVVNLRDTTLWNWYGEGDDMIFVDDEPWPPRLHGTGTEDYFNTAWCPNQEFHGPYHGITMPGGENWSGQVSYYRFHIEDPIVFDRSIKATIEHGHANKRSDDVSSTAYWYQTLPALPVTLAPVQDRLPRPL